MKRSFALSCALTVLLSSLFVMGASAAPPALPHVIYGSVSVQDGAATPGTAIYAYVADVLAAQTTVQASGGRSLFLVTVPGGEAVNQPDMGQSQGARVRFRVGTIWAPQTTQWQAGAVSQISLQVYPNRWLPSLIRS